MTLPIQFLDQVRERTVLSALIGRSIKVIKAGREHKACCPFHHEDTPSFTINDAKSFWHCFGCGRHGDAIRWLTDHGGLPFIEAVAQLAEAAGMDMPKRSAAEVQKAARLDGVRPILAAADAFYRAQIEPSGAPREYLFKRGIGDALIEEFGIGWAPADRYALKALGATDQGLLDAGLIMRFDDESAGPVFRSRIMVPIADARGRTIGFGGRAMGQEQPKYKNSPQSEIFDKGRILFNLHRAANAARAAKRLIVVEGYMDVIGLAAVGVREAVAPMGTAVTPAQIERLWLHHHSPILMFDGDKAGQAAAIRACETALPMVGPQGRSLSICVLPAGQDPDDLARAEGREAIEAVLAGAVPVSSFLFEGVIGDGSSR